MGLFSELMDELFDNKPQPNDLDVSRGIINYGDQRKDGGHDHRTNRGEDRTPAQRAGDAKRRNRENKGLM